MKYRFLTQFRTILSSEYIVVVYLCIVKVHTRILHQKYIIHSYARCMHMQNACVYIHTLCAFAKITTTATTQQNAGQDVTKRWKALCSARAYKETESPLRLHKCWERIPGAKNRTRLSELAQIPKTVDNAFYIYYITSVKCSFTFDPILIGAGWPKCGACMREAIAIRTTSCKCRENVRARGEFGGVAVANEPRLIAVPSLTRSLCKSLFRSSALLRQNIFHRAPRATTQHIRSIRSTFCYWSGSLSAHS